MPKKLGEALAFEWEVEDRPDKLWDILSKLEDSPQEAIADLADFSAEGSRLAMAYLGEIYADGLYGIEQNDHLAEHWLVQSMHHDSVEGAFRLAKFLENNRRVSEAQGILKELVAEGFSPAMYVLGMHHWNGTGVAMSKQRALRYLMLAEREGHVEAKMFIAKLMMSGYFGCLNRIVGVWCVLRLLLPIVKLKYSFPDSDWLRV